MSDCIICCNSADLFMYGECEHPMCLTCGLRIRFLGGSNECPVCRQEMRTCVVVDGARTVQDHSDFVTEKRFESRGIKFQSNELLRKAKHVLSCRCFICCKGETDFADFDGLRAHMQRKHELFYCEICVANILRFPFEFVCYSREQLALHRRVGTSDDKSQRGHPLCEFCDIRYLDDDQLYRHLRLDHFFCHLCEATGINKFFADRQHLVNHFRNRHHLCEEGRCRDEPLGVAFAHEIDLQYHRATEHASGADRGKVRLVHAMGVDVQQRRYGRQDDSWGYSVESLERIPIVPNPVPTFTMDTADFPALGGSQKGAASSSESRLPSWIKHRSLDSYSLDDFPELGRQQQSGGADNRENTAKTKRYSPFDVTEGRATSSTKGNERISINHSNLSSAPSTSAASLGVGHFGQPASHPAVTKGQVGPLVSRAGKCGFTDADDFPELPSSKTLSKEAVSISVGWKQVQVGKKGSRSAVEGSSKPSDQTKPRQPTSQKDSSGAVSSKVEQKKLKSGPTKLVNSAVSFEDAFPALGSSSVINKATSSGRWISPVSNGKQVNKKGLSQQLLPKKTMSTNDDDYPVLGEPVAAVSLSDLVADLGVSFSDALKTMKKEEDAKPPDPAEIKPGQMEPPDLDEVQFPLLSSEFDKKLKRKKEKNKEATLTAEKRAEDPSPLAGCPIEEGFVRSMADAVATTPAENAYSGSANEGRNEAATDRLPAKAAFVTDEQLETWNGRSSEQTKRSTGKKMNGSQASEKGKKKNDEAKVKAKKAKAASKTPDKGIVKAQQGKLKDLDRVKKSSPATGKSTKSYGNESHDEVGRSNESDLDNKYDKEYMTKQLKANCFRLFMLVKYPEVFKVCEPKSCRIQVDLPYKEPLHYHLRKLFFFIRLQADLPDSEMEQFSNICLQFKQGNISAGEVFSELLYLLGERVFVGIFKELLCLWNDIHQQRQLLKVYLEHCVFTMGVADCALGSVRNWLKDISLCPMCSQVVSDQDYDAHLVAHLGEDDS
uniref:RING-type domain-containing protein n=1 Tax=Trichuris muris TaxID=70415 RepID=A0A5S6R421_TRIMR